MVFEIDRDKVDLKDLFAITACVNDAPWKGYAARTLFLLTWQSIGGSAIRIVLEYDWKGHKVFGVNAWAALGKPDVYEGRSFDVLLEATRVV